MGAAESCSSGKAPAEYDPRTQALERQVQKLKQDSLERQVQQLKEELRKAAEPPEPTNGRAPATKSVTFPVPEDLSHASKKELQQLEEHVQALKKHVLEEQLLQVQALKQELQNQNSNGHVVAHAENSNGHAVACAAEPPSEQSPALQAALASIASDVPDLTDKATLMSMPLTVVVFGATGDLARKKLFPALYQLCLLDHMPRNLNIVGYGRSAVDVPKFIEKQCVNIKENPVFSKKSYTSRICFHAGGYDDPDSYAKLDAEIKKYENGKPGNRIYFLSVPPTIFGVVVQMISEKARAVKGGYTRLMIEKPFGRDSKTFAELDILTAKHFKSTQLYRLDHYLGKEVILNISTLRWGNQTFEPIWSAQHIESVQITFKEDLGTGGRGGYFDGFGIIRDIMQNHLLQAFMWLAMEPPSSMTAAAIIKAKVDLLTKVRTLTLDSDTQSCFFGQFTANGDEKGYLDDETVPKGSVCPTFASVVLRVDNRRWKGVPFLFTAGKGMDERVCELRIRFKKQPINKMMGVDDQNELVLRVQPDESMYMCTVAKEPGITAEQVRKPVVIGLEYSSQFEGAYVGDAYERMFLNTARGDQALFVSAPELVEAWRIFTPLLHQIDEKKPKPVLHPFGILPSGYAEFAASHGVTLKPTWHEYVAMNGDNVEMMKKVFAELDTDKDGALTYKEVAKLAKRFFDGREPTEARIAGLFRELDTDGDKKISLQELLMGAQKMQRSFEHGEKQMHGSMCG